MTCKSDGCLMNSCKSFIYIVLHVYFMFFFKSPSRIGTFCALSPVAVRGGLESKDAITDGEGTR
jgi:hypothetical protein